MELTEADEARLRVERVAEADSGAPLLSLSS
jgi:hypothetical protein